MLMLPGSPGERNTGNGRGGSRIISWREQGAADAAEGTKRGIQRGSWSPRLPSVTQRHRDGLKDTQRGEALPSWMAQPPCG